MTEKTPQERFDEYIHALKVWRVLSLAAEDMEGTMKMEGVQDDEGLKHVLSDLRTSRDDQREIVGRAQQRMKGVTVADSMLRGIPSGEPDKGLHEVEE